MAVHSPGLSMLTGTLPNNPSDGVMVLPVERSAGRLGDLATAVPGLQTVTPPESSLPDMALGELFTDETTISGFQPTPLPPPAFALLSSSSSVPLGQGLTIAPR